ncbi:UbiA family prenyltransferase [Halomonas sp. SpR8]|uniref:UbiA family prenyltransferase n=1 Tax=Halomonas sp. SpR8 TaxID=3050463 RepID=UPI0027E50834|nr:UbiA family prenyltransferase [Halomonas sp. SpR8]MDQ7730155.1 UbiA family prenyltransferase [Halomonas sp. SpR8]
MNTTEEQGVSGTSTLALARKWIRAEALITWRMVRDNLPIGIFPVSLFALSSGIGEGLSGADILENASKALVIGFLFAYVYDSWGQIHSLKEDAFNKPYRPIPAGLATPQSLQQRAWIGSVLYIVMVWLLGLWVWALLWPFIIVVQSRWAPERGYLWWKPVSNYICQVLMFATGWHLSTSLDASAWSWILAVSAYFTLAYVIEDVRDIKGDRAIGRITLAIVLGRAFICRFFAVFMIFLPVFYFVLARMSGADDWRGLLAAVIIGALSWTCAARALCLQGHDADKRTYLLYCLTWVLTCASAPLLLT